jgi:hypothetical protein
MSHAVSLWRVTKNTFCPSGLASKKYESAELVPVEIKWRLPSAVSYSYPSHLPFESSGTNASTVLKNTCCPSSESALLKCCVGAEALTAGETSVNASPVATLARGLHETHANVPVSALYK